MGKTDNRTMMELNLDIEKALKRELKYHHTVISECKKAGADTTLTETRIRFARRKLREIQQEIAASNPA